MHNGQYETANNNATGTVRAVPLRRKQHPKHGANHWRREESVVKLLCDRGCACADYHHRNVRNLTVQRLQCDEIWSFVGAKKKNITPAQELDGWGDVWTWTATDADTKLCVTYFVGDRGKHSAFAFMEDCASRINGRLQITTDQHKPYLASVERALGGDADYAQLHKIYGATEANEARYSPATCIGCEMKTVSGVPAPQACQHVVCRASEPHHAYVYAPVYSPDEWIFKEGRESRPCSCAVLRLLQLLPGTSDIAHQARDGSRPIRSRLDCGGIDRPFTYASSKEARPLQEEGARRIILNTMLQRVYLIICPECGESIPLPRRSLLGTFEHPLRQPTDIWPITYLCSECESLSVHKEQMIRLQGIEAPVQNQSAYRLWCCEFDKEGVSEKTRVFSRIARSAKDIQDFVESIRRHTEIPRESHLIRHFVVD